MNMEQIIEKNQVQIFQNRINRLSGQDSKKRDSISLIILAQFCIPILTSIQFFIKMITPLFISILSSLYTLNSLVDYGLGVSEDFYIYTPTPTELNWQQETFLLFAEFVKKIPIIAIFFLLLILFKRENIRNEIIRACLFILIYMALLDEYKYPIVYLLVLFFLSLPQIGTGRPYYFVNNIFYFISSILNNRINNKQQNNAYKEHKQNNDMLLGTFWFIGGLFISKILSVWFGIPLTVSLLLSIVLITRFSIHIQSSKTKNEIVIKAVIYTIVFCVVLLTNEVTDEIISLMTVAIAIFFALDRFFALYEDLIQNVKKESIEYYSMEEARSDYYKKYISDEILFSIKDTLSDDELLIQGVIRANMNLSESFDYFEKEFRNYKNWQKYELFLISLKFYMKKRDGEEISIIDFIEERRLKALIGNQIYLPIQFIVDYGLELMKLKKYESASQYLCYSEYYSSLDYIKKYYECVKEIDRVAEVKRLERKYSLT